MPEARPAVMRFTRAELERCTGGHLIGRAQELSLRGAAIDSRLVSPGGIFACFEGERVDGHDYAAVAVGNGASLVIASKDLDEVPVPVLQVADVGAALGSLAQEFRCRYRGATWIGITGSNGKTTVKELLRALCASVGSVHATSGNFNNRLGVPLTILATPPGMRHVVIEMGASSGGEIDTLAALCTPDYGLITTIGPAHLEGFGGLRGVASGKAELLRHTRRGALVNLCGCAPIAAAHDLALDQLAAIVRAAAVCPVRLLDETENVDIDLNEDPAVLIAPDGQRHRLRMAGRHSAYNVLLVLALAAELGIERGAAMATLARVEAVPGRLQEHRLSGGHRLFDDSYNANPASMQAGLQVLAQQPGARLAVLGGMGELGPTSDALHASVGAEAARLGLPLLTVGTAAQAIAAGYRAAGGRDCAQAADKRAAITFIQERCTVGPCTVLIKASRAAALDEVVQGLLDAERGETACSVYSSN